MGQTFEVPLKARSQRMSIDLNGVTYRLTVKWNDPNQSWIMDLADQNDVPIVSGIPLITGADLLSQLEYLGFGGSFIASVDTDDVAVPNYQNLGTTGHLYFLTP